MCFRLSFAVLISFSLMLGHGRTGICQTTFELMAKAQPDEFYAGIGEGYYPLGEQPPDLEGQPKVNYDYIWGMDTDDRYIWFGTASNVGAYSAAAFQLIIPHEFKSPEKEIPYRVWEYDKSKFPRPSGPVSHKLGDLRPPRIYRYDTQTHALDDITPDDPLLKQTVGIRSMGVFDGVVLAGGPTLNMLGICLYAFDQETGQFLGSKLVRAHSNIRRWVRVQGALYTAVEQTWPMPARGAVLRWRGSLDSPFEFETVGYIDNTGAYIAEHENRLVVGTWASRNTITTILNLPPPIAGLWVSPPIPEEGLEIAHATQWEKVWAPDQYEPDPVMAETYSMGAMIPYGDHLYFGTMHYPGLALQAFYNAYAMLPGIETFQNTSRATAIFRGKNWGADDGPTIELLYGEPELPVFSPNGGNGSWSMTPNNMGPAKYGLSGFGEPDNGYLWTGTVHQGRLYLGTFDFSLDFGKLLDGQSKPRIGADLYMIPAPESPATALSINGLGNPANHGIRNIISTPDGLYFGTANSMNLLTDPTDDLPDGGWELRRMTDE